MPSANEAALFEDTSGIRKRFRTLLELGRGGMAQVFLAESISLGVRKLVVLKLLNSELSLHTEMQAAFRREAEISARMNHPNVVQVFEVVERSGQAMIVMEYLDGLPLSRVLRHGNLPLSLHLDILTQVLDGLHHFHELKDLDQSPLNAVHRDVSPQNVLILHEGVAKVLDFGVAKFRAIDHDHTRSGLIKGKIHYMPPEQLLGDEAVDRRADIFAVGVMLWEALAGRRLWRDVPETQVVRSLARGEIPRLREASSSVPPELERIVERALQPEASARFESAEQMRDELSRATINTVGLPLPRALQVFMQEHFSEARRVQKTRIDEARRQSPLESCLNDPLAHRLLPESSPPPTAGRGSDTVMVTWNSRPPNRGSSPPVPAAPPVQFVTHSNAFPADPRRRSFVPTVLLVAFALGVGWVVYDEARQSSSDPQAVRSQVQLHVLVAPAEAEILLDDVPLGQGSYQGFHDTSASEHRVVARAPGYKTREEKIRLDQNVVRLIRLEPLLKSGAAEAPNLRDSSPQSGSPPRKAKPSRTRAGGAPAPKGTSR